MKFGNLAESREAYASDREMLEFNGVIMPPSVIGYLSEDVRRDYTIAMDAQPTLTTTANSAIPTMLTTVIDPQVYEVLFAPLKAAKILGEQKKGDWLTETAMFPIAEHVGEVSSYGDFNQNGHTGVNANWPQRQSYGFQTIKIYGEKELERAGLGKINWVSEIDVAAAWVLSRFLNQTYFFGVSGLQNYGLLNDPSLSAALTPSTKAYGGVKWVVNGQVVATANEIFNDIQSLFSQLIAQSTGLIDQETSVVLALSPGSQLALTATNSFNVNVAKLLKDNFPNIRIETAVQYGVTSASNPQGNSAGNLVQMIAEGVEGQQTGYCAFTEKQRAHPIVTDMSSWRQKVSGGSWGAIIRQGFAIASMVGV